MRHRVERTTCPVCRNSPVLKAICSACSGDGEAIILHKPNGIEIEIYPLRDEVRLRMEYPDAPTPIFERTTIAQAWKSFMREVEIQHVSDGQKREMRRAFYGGAHWMLNVLQYQLDPGTDATEDDVQYLYRIDREIQSFAQSITSGDV